jgi:uridine phosphorylase
MFKTLAGSSYYEAQARLDGSVCNFSSKKKQNCLKTLYEMGVRNMEMEVAIVFIFVKIIPHSLPSPSAGPLASSASV